MILTYIYKHPDCKFVDIYKDLGMNYKFLERELRNLRKNNYVSRSGSRRIYRYFIAPKGMLSILFDGLNELREELDL
jgi:DNA-binding MarR family transcriptional regulator